MRTPILIPVLAAVAVAPSAMAHAASPAQTVGHPVRVPSPLAQALVGRGVERLTRLREQNLILKQELTQATLRSKIRQAEGRLGPAAGTKRSHAGFSPSTAHPGTTPSSAGGEPLSSPSTHSVRPEPGSRKSHSGLYTKSFPAPGKTGARSHAAPSASGQIHHAEHIPPSKASAPAASPPAAMPSQLPKVLAVWTLGHAQSAALRLSNGGQVDVKAGGALPGGGQVVRISTQGVEALYGHASVWLPFAKAAKSEMNQQPITLPPLGNGPNGQ